MDEHVFDAHLYVLDNEDQDKGLQFLLTKKHGSILGTLSPEAFLALKRSIAGIECELCGGNHPASYHGVPVIVVDTDRSQAEHWIGAMIESCIALFTGNTTEELDHKEFFINQMRDFIKVFDEFSRGQSEYEVDYPWWTDMIDERLGNAGYITYSNSDGGSWMVYTCISDELPD